MAGIRTIFVNPAAYDSREDYDMRLVELLREVRADLVCLAGYMRILTPVLVQAYAGKNFEHPPFLAAQVRRQRDVWQARA